MDAAHTRLDIGNDDSDNDSDSDSGTGSAWAVFGDLMSGLLGAFVLLLVCVLALQLELTGSLQAEVARREAEEQRRQALEQALERVLATPLATGRVTLDEGRIGISGSVLFSLGSAQLQAEGRQLLDSLATPLAAYLGARDEWLMVSGFTDDRPVRESSRLFEDNLELSAQRALTVTRALIQAGVPASTVFAAAFGPQQPVASNADAAGRARNRRVEMAPVPRSAAPERPAAEPSRGLSAVPGDRAEATTASDASATHQSDTRTATSAATGAEPRQPPHAAPPPQR